MYDILTMKKLILLLAFLLISSVAHATVYYVRVSGGTGSQCTGTTNANYSGTGIGQACAFNHPAWALGATGTNGVMVGGDTLIIDDNSGTAQYLVGYGMPNTVGCNPFSSSVTDCTMKAIPASSDVNNPTKIFGSAYNTGCATKPQLYGTQSVKQILYVQGSNNIDIECIEVTDHSTCGFRLGNQCSENYGSGNVGTYGRAGIAGAFLSNFVMKNVDVHGMAFRNILVGNMTGTNNWLNVNSDGSYGGNIDGDANIYGGSGGILNGGTLLIDHMKNRFSGCQEAYPRSGSFSVNDYNNCVDQNANPPGYGDGLGTADSTGTFIITDSEFSHNTQDGLDLLYCPSCNIYMARNLFEGNNGNQIKVTAKILKMDNNVEVANCTYLSQAGKVFNTGSFSSCRANGTPISATAVLGSAWLIQNNTAYTSTGSGGSPFIEVISRYGTCNGTETYNYNNNVLYNANHTWTAYYNGLSGSCSTAWNAATTTKSDIYNFTSAPSGTGVVTTNPLFVGAISNTASSNLANVYLTASSPGKGTGGTGLTYWNGAFDVNSYPLNGSVDMGGIAFGSVLTLTPAGQACVATTDCASGTCSSFFCSGATCKNIGVACSTNSECCFNNCSASACAAAASCGDNIIQPGETCDGTNLNNSSCPLQGFTGGTLACASDCHSYNTTGCNNTVTFPLTPILDTMTRANSTGIGNTSWTLFSGSMNIVSNYAIPVNASANNRYYWNASTFGQDEEAYMTIANKGSNSDTAILYARYDVGAGTGYKLQANTGANTLVLYTVQPSGQVQIDTVSQTITTGDSFGMSLVGSTIKTWYKVGAGAWATIKTTTDSSYSTAGTVSINSFTGSGTPDIHFTNVGGGTLNPVTCGNQVKESGEICDSPDLGGQTCANFGYASGSLACNANCQSFDFSSCSSAAVCGNAIKETGEICDLTALNSQTCAGLGFTSGTLGCQSDCKAYDTSGCVTTNSGLVGAILR